MLVQPAAVVQDVRLYIFNQAAETARVPQPAQIAAGLGRPIDEIRDAVTQLAAGRVIVLAPNDGHIWSAPPFCAVPSSFKVVAAGKTYWAMCIWDALGIPSALGADAVVHTTCGDCGEAMHLELRDGALISDGGIVHFGVPARHFWDNIAFT